MSKERLEIIEKMILVDKVPSKESIKWLTEYAKDQAERVQELERSNKMLDGNFKTVKQQSDLQERINRKLVDENRRYRELLKECRDVSLDVVKYARLADEPKLYGLSKKISETLEDDPHCLTKKK